MTHMPPLPPAPKSHKIAITLAFVAVLVLGGAVFIVVRPFLLGFARGYRQAVSVAPTVAPTAPMAADPDAAVAFQPIVIPSNSITHATVNKRRLAFRLRNYVDAYRQNGAHDKPWDADAVVFLTAWLNQSYDGSDFPATDPVAAADHLVALGCDDPVVLTGAGALSIEWFEARKRLEKALAAYGPSHYNAYPQFYATVLLATHTNASPALDQYDARALALLKKIPHRRQHYAGRLR